ncbi:hypothetical protein [Parasediminibacterium sp. JCM 36343]|uniref:hypothetical protein n=1 Tax=Parasediminibacterium sp. JCM 36343 TaxID=3374279 RepID=UPI00397E2F2E
MKEIIDILDRNKTFADSDEKLVNLREGFTALALDYGFHIENIWGGNHKILELKENVTYRLFSSLFHYQLLLKQHYFIEQRIEKRIKNEPERYTTLIYPKKHPDFEYAEKEVSAIFDSIVFHLASIFDYLSILINFCISDKEKTPQWTSISKSARDPQNDLSKRDIAGTIESLNKEFVIRLYDYRSELIHKRSDINEYSFESRIEPGKLLARFICSNKIRRTFKNYGEESKDYTVSHFSVWLIDMTANLIAKILLSLKREIKKDSKFPFHTYKDGTKPFLMYVDPITNVAASPASPHWEKFGKHFNDI